MRPQKSVRNSSFCNCIIFIFQEKGLRSTKPYKMMKQVAPLVAKTTLQLTRSDTKTDSRADEKWQSCFPIKENFIHFSTTSSLLIHCNLKDKRVFVNVWYTGFYKRRLSERLRQMTYIQLISNSFHLRCTRLLLSSSALVSRLLQTLNSSSVSSLLV